MKKYIAIIMCLLIALFFIAACQSNSDSGLEDDEGSYSVILEDNSDDSQDVFEQIDSLNDKDTAADHEEVADVKDETKEDTEDVVNDKESDNEKTVTKTKESGVYKITVNEGELVKVRLNAKDPDGDALTYTYEKPLDSNGEWQTQMGDDGKYYTTVTVSDGKNDVDVDILIEVLSVNEDPVLKPLDDITVNEGETVKIRAKATDADGDDLTFTYSGWMTSDTKKTGYDDAGKHKVTVTVSDGNGGEDSQTITVTVNDVNRAPVIEGLE